MRTPSLPRTILFDLDNTFYLYAPCHQRGMEAVARCSILKKLFKDRESFELEFHRARTTIKSRIPLQAASHNRTLYFQSMIEKNLPVLDSRLTLELTACYWDTFIQGMSLLEGALEFLDLLAARGIRFALVSDMTAELQHRKLVQLGLDGRFEFLLTSEEAGVEKPHPEIGVLAIERLNAAPESTWIIGDSLERDIGLAEATGMFGVLINHPEIPASDQPKPDLHVHSFSELAAYFKQA